MVYDRLFGKRGKNDLVGLNLDLQGVVRFVDKWANKEVEVDGCLGTVTTFIVEPFVEHGEYTHSLEWIAEIR